MKELQIITDCKIILHLENSFSSINLKRFKRFLMSFKKLRLVNAINNCLHFKRLIQLLCTKDQYFKREDNYNNNKR